MHARATTFEAHPRMSKMQSSTTWRASRLFARFPATGARFCSSTGQHGKAIGVTLWESEEAMQVSRERADELREQAQEAPGESVDEYEVAVWEVG